MRSESRWRSGSRENVAEAAQRAQALKEQIARVGQTLAVTTPAQGGNAAITRQIAFVPQPINASTLTRLQYEGVVNIAAGMTIDFVCAGDAHVTNGDQVGLYEGASWMVVGTQPEMYGGVALARHVIAQRQ